MTQRKPTDAAIAECRAMTQMMKDSVARYEAEQAEYMQRVAEYSRRKRNYDTTAQFFLSECAGNLEPGDVFFRGGHPACRNRKLNVPPIEPTPPVLPSLGTFICQICSQDVNLTGQAGRDFNVAKDAIQQQMNCVATAEQQMMREEEAAKDRAEDASPAAAASHSSQTQTVTEKKTAAAESNATMFIIILIICVLVAVAIGIAIYSYGAEDVLTSLT